MSGERATETSDEDGREDWPDPSTDVPDDWLRRERAFRGISVRLAVHYLGKLGGEVVDGIEDGSGDAEDTKDAAGVAGGEDAEDADEKAQAVAVAGDGWRATLSSVEVGIGPTVSLTEVRIAFAGDPDGLDDLIDRFAQKAMRAGG